MLQSNLEKQPTKAEAVKKAEAWKTLNEVLVKTNSEFMSKLNSLLLEKQIQQEELKAKLESGNGTDEDNAHFLFLSGYVDCLRDILNVKGRQNY